MTAGAGLLRLPPPGSFRYGHTLLLTLLALVFIMAAPEGTVAALVTLALLGLVLISALRVSGIDGRLRAAAGTVFGLALAVGVALTFLGSGDEPAFVRAATTAVVLIATPGIGIGIVHQLRRGRRVTLHTMTGVLCIYLLLALGFASGFGLVANLSGDAFFTQGARWDQLSTYLYFSITTITTVGMGDFAPASDLGRSLTAAEALIGQIYLVTVVAVIVSNLGRRA